MFKKWTDFFSYLYKIKYTGYTDAGTRLEHFLSNKSCIITYAAKINSTCINTLQNSATKKKLFCMMKKSKYLVYAH